MNILGINVNEINSSATTLHEIGHALYHNFKGDNLNITPTQRMQDIIQNAQNNINNNPEKLNAILDIANTEYNHYRDLTVEWYEGIRQSENDRIASLVSSLYAEENTTELTNFVNTALKNPIIREDLNQAGISTNDIENLLSDRETITIIAQRQNAINQQNQHLSLLMSDPSQGLEARKTYSILNSIMQNEQISLPDGSTTTFIYGHPNSYWTRALENGKLNAYELSYDELMADYFAISSLGQTELIDNLRELAGNELFDSLSNEYEDIVNIAKDNNLI